MDIEPTPKVRLKSNDWRPVHFKNSSFFLILVEKVGCTIYKMWYNVFILRY